MASAIAREGYPFLIFSLITAIILYIISSMAQGHWLIIWRALSVIVFLFALFTAYFFRDPERIVPYDDNALLSPADGTIIDIREVEEPLYLKENVKRVSIFMSPFNVHINRTPLTGVIDFVHYHPGKFLSAFKEKASLDNESILIGIRDSKGVQKIAVKLIAGLIARRIVFNKKPGDALRQGERMGMIRFGSRAELFCPLSTEIRIKNGDTVNGGLTVIGILK
jgi:phosphatidylserine decarboxylase